MGLLCKLFYNLLFSLDNVLQILLSVHSQSFAVVIFLLYDYYLFTRHVSYLHLFAYKQQFTEKKLFTNIYDILFTQERSTSMETNQNPFMCVFFFHLFACFKIRFLFVCSLQNLGLQILVKLKMLPICFASLFMKVPFHVSGAGSLLLKTSGFIKPPFQQQLG